MKHLIVLLNTLVAVLLVTGCISTRVQLGPEVSPEPKPFDDFMDYYLLGFVGHPEININKICGEQKPLALQRLKTGEDVIIGIVTLGIYTPSTVRVWCVD